VRLGCEVIEPAGPGDEASRRYRKHHGEDAVYR
jgi:hypothetical protein